MKKPLSLFTTALLAVQLISCKGPEGAPGPAGAPGKDGSSNNFTGAKSGFIKGTAQGTTLDGKNFSFFLDLQGVSDPYRSAYSVDDEGVYVEIVRGYAGDLNNLVDGYSSINFRMDSLTSKKEVTGIYYACEFVRDLGGGKYIVLNRSHSPAPTPVSGTTTKDTSVQVYDVVYDSVKGEISGKYKVSLEKDSYNGSLYINNGTFTSKLSQVSYRIGAED